MDIMLDTEGDIFFTEEGDFLMKESVAQQIRIKVLWFAGEWRWDPDLGLPYREDLLIKNPNIASFENELRKAIFDVTEVVKVEDLSVVFDRKNRNALIKYTALTDLETIREEVEIRCQITA